jgi:hypothetical protein
LAHHGKLLRKSIGSYPESPKPFSAALLAIVGKSMATARRLAKFNIDIKLVHVRPSVAPATEKRFIRLRDKWKSETAHESSTTRLVLHPAYQGIIGMGPDIVPLLLRELDQEPQVGFWFWALHAITQEDPVSSEDRGDGKAMAKAWIAWGKAQAYGW